MKHKRQSILGPEPVSVPDARRQCYVTDPNEDAVLQRYIWAARDYAEKEIWRAITPATYLAFADEFPEEIELPYPPLVSVEKVEYKATDGTLTELDAAKYEVDTLSEPGRIRPVDQWPQTQRDAYNCVQVSYTAGYLKEVPNGVNQNTAPEAVEHAMLMMVKHFYDNPEAVIVSGGSLSVVEVPLGAKTLLQQESVRTVG